MHRSGADNPRFNRRFRVEEALGTVEYETKLEEQRTGKVREGEGHVMQRKCRG